MIKRANCKLEWTKLDIFSESRSDSKNSLEKLDPFSRRLFQTLQETGLPTFKEAPSPEQEAIWLLEVAAEIEHALLVEYLYSAYSIDSNDDFQRTLTNISIQEMGHLITVQNLLLSIGGNVYFERQDESPQDSLDPFPFTLEPFSKSVLAKYILAEMPLIEELLEEEKAEIEEIRNEHQLDVGMGINRVGALYLKLYWLFQSSDEPEGDWKLSKEIIPAELLGKHISSLDSGAANIDFQTDKFEWGGSVPGLQIDLVNNRADALKALYRISAQGEGFTGPIDSHFERFRELYRQYDSASLTIRDVPTNPFISKTPENDPNREQNRISNPIAQILVELADVRYKKMLLHLIQFFSYSKTGSQNDQDLRQNLIKWSLDEMKKGIVTLSRIVQDLPRSTTNTESPTKAALILTIPRQVFPSSRDEQWQLLSQLLNRSSELESELGNLSDDLSISPIISLSVDRVISDDQDTRQIIAAQTTDSDDFSVV